ncbi:MAG: acetyl-CoA carboxylase biotin carboxyl carrier protein [Pseudomonadota bacterium]
MAASKPFDKEFIKELAEMLANSDLTEIELEHGDSRLRVSREVKQTIYASHASEMPVQYNAPQSLPQPSAPTAVEAQPETSSASGESVTSPMVGTAYLAPEPGAPNFVKVGQSVSEGETLLIVEAMKVMNNIPAPCSGVVKAILVQDKEGVEFGQTLVIIE